MRFSLILKESLLQGQKKTPNPVCFSGVNICGNGLPHDCRIGEFATSVMQKIIQRFYETQGEHKSKLLCYCKRVREQIKSCMWRHAPEQCLCEALCHFRCSGKASRDDQASFELVKKNGVN